MKRGLTARRQAKKREMALYRVTFQDDSVRRIEADRVAKFPNLGLWVFTVAADDMMVAAFAERKVRNIEVTLDEECLEPRAGGI